MDIQTKKDKGWDYFLYALYAFAGLGIEVLLAFFIEPLIYGCSMNEWSTAQNISHWVIICVCWGLICFFLAKTSKNKYGYDVFMYQNKMKLWQWCTVIAIFILMIVISYVDWNGSKVLKELQYNGLLKFIFQYIYYIFEVGLMVLIIVFGQKAFEKWFHDDCHVLIPYGGILTGFTWGMVHILTKGSITMGVSLIFISIGYGATYLLVNRDIRKAYIWILLMFVL
ncbi:MAG: hypothetical protein IKL87_01340 [Oscillospiraceae bacterium]|nr:hypothetical protein [Oscillospiraceae bacterium]